MAMTLTQKTDMYRFFAIAFDAAPGVTYMTQLDTAFASGMTTKQIVNVFTTKAEFTASYPNFLDNTTFATKLVNNVVGTSATDAAKLQAVSDIVGALNIPGTTRGDVIYTIFNNLANMPVGDATWGATAQQMANQVAVSQYYTETLLSDSTDLPTLRAVIANVTNVPATVATAEAAIGSPITTFTLTPGLDILPGSSLADIFTSNVEQNTLGQQVNTLGSGDTLNGGGAVDTLNAKITAGAFVNGGGSATMPIQPETHSIETVKLQAVNSRISGSNNNGSASSTEVYVNAKDMYDVTKISSDNSDANLTIQNLTTLNTDGSRHALKEMTVGMAYTGNSDSAWNESDMHVYFDQDYITPQISSATSVDIRLMNQDAYDVSVGLTPLGIAISSSAVGPTYISEFTIVLNAKTYDLAPYLTPEVSAANKLTDYAAELAAVKAAIVKLQAANPTDAALQTLTASIITGNTFTADAPVDSTTGNVSGVARIGQAVTLSVAGGATVNTLTVGKLLLTPVDQNNTNMNLFNRSLAFTPTSDTNLAINVDLTKVGNWGDGGSLVIGSMYKNGLNEWSSQYKGKGINEFDVTVHGTQVTNGDDQSSSLKQLASTGNNLKIVKVVSDALVTKEYADLAIGNSQTESASGSHTPLAKGDAPSANNANALKDVKTFDASGFKGDLSLFAALTGEVTAKYLNVVDGSPAAPAADNVAFVYTGGIGNDYINLSLDPANFVKKGTVTREDLTLTVNGGTGNDEIVVKIAETGIERNGSVSDNWYANQHITAGLKLVGGVATGQLQLNGGDGNDTIRKLGSGDFAINGGIGDDAIYADNTGSGGAKHYTGLQFNSGRGSAVFNATNSDPYHLLSQDHTISQDQTMTFAGNLAAKVNVTVSFMGFEKSVAVTSTSVAGVQTITDLMINQAIKTAVNADPVLAKLAIAEDGPGHTLVLRSLIDGSLTLDDYSISLSPVAAVPLLYTAVTLAQLDEAFGTTAGVYADNWMTEGADSTSTSDNLIVGGTGNDVIVLSTGPTSQEGVGYAGLANGTDSIVNFNSVWHDAAATTYNSESYEIVNLTFSASDGNPPAETIIFDGVTVNLAAPTLQGIIPALDVATQFTTQYNAAAATNGWVAEWTGAGNVTLTHDVPGAVADLTAASFTGNYFAAFPGTVDGNGVVGVAIGTDAVNNGAGTSSTFTVTYTTATTAAVADISTTAATPTALLLGDGSFSIATKVAATALAGYTVGPVVHTATGDSVTFTASAVGATAIGTAAQYLVDAATAADGIIGSVTGTVGTAAGTIPVIATLHPAGPDIGADYLDFSSYGIVAVYVGASQAAGALVAGAAPAAGAKYILMTELTGASVGAYTMNEYTEAGVTDPLVGSGLVGVADFGATETFHANNFVLV